MWVCLWLALGFDASIGNQVSLAWTRVPAHQDPDSNQPPLPPPSPRLFWRDPDKISGQQLFQSWLRYVSLSCSIAPFHPFFNSSLITFGAGCPTDSQSCSSICALVRAGVFLKYNSLYLTVSGIELAHISMKLLTGFKSQSGARHIQGYKATHLCYLPPTDISEIMLGLLSNSTRSASGVGN